MLVQTFGNHAQLFENYLHGLFEDPDMHEFHKLLHQKNYTLCFYFLELFEVDLFVCKLQQFLCILTNSDTTLF